VDPLDEGDHHLALGGEGQALEAVAQAGPEGRQQLQVLLQGDDVVVLGLERLDLLLHRRLLLGQLGDQALAGRDVHPLAEGAVVVVDPAVDLAELGLRSAWIHAVLAASGLDPGPQLALQLVPACRVAEAGLERVDDDALDPGHVERQRLADIAAFEQVARAEVAEVDLLLALVVDVLAASADEGVAAAVAGDEAPEQVVDVLVGRGVDRNWRSGARWRSRSNSSRSMRAGWAFFVTTRSSGLVTTRPVRPFFLVFIQTRSPT
jgi:hypothetical protein